MDPSSDTPHSKDGAPPDEPPDPSRPTPPIADTEPFRRAHASALRLLSYKPRSEAEVQARLRHRFPPDVVETVVRSLKERSLVDDAAFARAWAESRSSHRPRSAWAVKRELMSKGVDRTLAEDSVRGIDDDDGAYRAALPQARRLAEEGFDTFRRRLWGYLKRRGYSDSVSRRAIDQLWEETTRAKNGLTADGTREAEWT